MPRIHLPQKQAKHSSCPETGKNTEAARLPRRLRQKVRELFLTSGLGVPFKTHRLHPSKPRGPSEATESTAPLVEPTPTDAPENVSP